MMSFPPGSKPIGQCFPRSHRCSMLSLLIHMSTVSTTYAEAPFISLSAKHALSVFRNSPNPDRLATRLTIITLMDVWEWTMVWNQDQDTWKRNKHRLRKVLLEVKMWANTIKQHSWVLIWRRRPVIPALRRPMQEDCRTLGKLEIQNKTPSNSTPWP